MHITHHLFAATLTAMSGASVMVGMDMSGRTDPGLVLSAACGAFIAGAFAAPLFGHGHRQGAVMAAIGAIFATALGAAIAGLGLALVAAEPLAVLVAPVIVAAAILASPHLLLVWVVTMAGVHLVMRFVRHVADDAA